MEENEKEIKINVPTGYVIDRENSTFECIKFRKKKSRFADYDGSYNISGFYITEISSIKPHCDSNSEFDKNLFASEDAAKSALAFAQITQIREHETDKYGFKPKFNDIGVCCIVYDTEHSIIIVRKTNARTRLESYLSFDTYEHANLFLNENAQLVKEYFMMD